MARSKNEFGHDVGALNDARKGSPNTEAVADHLCDDPLSAGAIALRNGRFISRAPWNSIGVIARAVAADP